MAGKASRDKGGRRERQAVALFRSAGIEAERVPLSGAAQGSFRGDLRLLIPGMGLRRAEVKARAGAEGWKTIKGWLGDNALLLLMEDRAEPLVVMPWRTFALMSELLGELTLEDLEEKHEGAEAEAT